MSIIDDFKDRFPEFDTTIVDTYLPTIIDVYPCYYGGPYENCGVEIILNLLAHMLLEESVGASTALQAESSKSIGSVSVSYLNATGTITSKRSWLMGSRYGIRFLALTAHNHGGFFV